ncbi:MAG: esterase-like activity of phytase family protein [Rhodopirellula sp.]|nr:esterase-like activity of phytase family protein [Rhodopirellula sp.]
MLRLRLILVCGLAILFCDCESTRLHAEKPELIGVASFSGTMSDLSTFEDKLGNGEPHNRLGGFSALEYTGKGNRYAALSDRGPDDGATGYQCRYHFIDIKIEPKSSPAVTTQLISTEQLFDQRGRAYPGLSSQIEPSVTSAARFDPEGFRFGQDGRFWIAEEYGPQIIEFGSDNQAIRSLKLPELLRVQFPAGIKQIENNLNEIGRASNKGIEGLAFSPDGEILFAIMQHVLLQDCERDEAGKPRGLHCRLLRFDTRSGEVQEFVYRLNSTNHVLSEILAVSNYEFLVIERDTRSGADARFKKVVRIDIRAATEIGSVRQLSPWSLPDSIKPVKKTAHLDLLDPTYHLSGEAMPEKLEGLTFGPALKDGRRTLVIASDNDFNADSPSSLFVFAEPTDADRGERRSKPSGAGRD